MLFFIGCSISTKQVKENLPFNNLSLLLEKYEDKIDKNEAIKLSSQMFLQANRLKKEYKLVKPPLFHNFLVNIGAKKRGLCWHFAYDMLLAAKKLNLKSFDYYIGGANINEYWQEHNALIITCKGCKFSDGIVIDPWRNSGKLYYSKINNDHEYKWTQRGEIRN